MSALFKTVSIVGLGLVGGSIAAGIKQRGLADQIAAFDSNKNSLSIGLEQGLIDKGCDSIVSAIDDADLIILAVPVLSIGATLSELKNTAAIITDVGSVKSPVVKAAKEVFGKMPGNFIPGHPIAGSEKHGVTAANPDLFERHKVILTPSANSDKSATDSVRKLWEALGAKVIEMTPDHHDLVFAQTSHLPHLLAYALVDMLSAQGESFEIFEYAAGGFRDFSRIAASEPVMWRDIFDANGEKVLPILDKYMDELSQIRTLIAEGKMKELEALFKRAKIARDHFSSINKPS
ncbi:MAG: prephenate dehydrogenase/arogenate dehydrogenase family protein [Pseudomonadales bacterium]